jgi:hypothetical protein
MTTKLSRIDRNALQRAIQMVRQRDSAAREHIDAMRRSDTFQEVGEFAASSCQSRSLHLSPWQTPPIWVGSLTAALRLPYGDQRGDREAAELLKKMLAAGLSRYEPDPLAALDRNNLPPRYTECCKKN